MENTHHKREHIPEEMEDWKKYQKKCLIYTKKLGSMKNM